MVANALGFYTNLITSGIGLPPERARALKQAGLDHVQLEVLAGREMHPAAGVTLGQLSHPQHLLGAGRAARHPDPDHEILFGLLSTMMRESFQPCP